MDQPDVLAMVGAAVVVLAGWARYALSRPDAVVDLRLVCRGPVLLANVAAAALGVAMFVTFYGNVVQLQLPTSVDHGFGASFVTAGAVLLPGALAMMAMSPLSARLSEARGPRTMLLGGGAIVAAGCAVRLVAASSLAEVALGVVVVNCGVGIGYGALPAVVLAHVPITDTASANSINTLARMIGSALASAGSAAILAGMTTFAAGHGHPSSGAIALLFAVGVVSALLVVVAAARLPRRGP